MCDLAKATAILPGSENTIISKIVLFYSQMTAYYHKESGKETDYFEKKKSVNCEHQVYQILKELETHLPNLKRRLNSCLLNIYSVRPFSTLFLCQKISSEGKWYSLPHTDKKNEVSLNKFQMSIIQNCKCFPHAML